MEKYMKMFSMIILAFLLLFQPAITHAGSLKIGGTGAALGGMRLLLDAFQEAHPEIAGDILFGMGSGGGIRAVSAGAIDIAVSARPLKDSEQVAGIKAEIYAKTAIVFATPLANGTTTLSTAELINIFTGVKTSWADGTNIRIVLRPEIESDVILLKAHIPEMIAAWDAAKNIRGIPVAYTDQMSAEMIQTLPGGLGMSTLAQIYSENLPLRALVMNDVVPTVETIADGSYPLIKTLYLVMPVNSSERAREFIVFLRSDEGTAILQEAGHFIPGTKED